MPNFSVNASASSAESGAVPDVTARMPSRSSRRQLGVQHHAQCGGHQRHRAGPVPAHRVGPPVEVEAVQQRERPCLCDALQHPEHAADVHQRCVDDRDTASRVPSVPGDVPASRPDHAARQHVVGEVDPLRRPVVPLVSIRTATPGSAGVDARRPSAGSDLGVGPRTSDITRRAVSRGATSVVRSSALPMITRQVQRGDVGPGAFVAAGRVDDDHRAARQQHAEEGGDMGGPVAQQDADLAAAVDRATRCGEPVRRPDPRWTTAPSYSIADASGAMSSTSAIRCRSGWSVITGSVARTSPARPVAASSAVPIGFPSRV